MILLTKEMSEQLDFYKLDELTIIRTEQGTLALAGKECGKIILNFSSIPISKKLTVTERTILINDYIMPVLSKYSKNILSLITIMKDKRLEDDLKKFVEEEEVNNSFYLSKSTSYNHSDKQTTVGSYQVSSEKITRDATMKIVYDTRSKEYSVYNTEKEKNPIAAILNIVKRENKLKLMSQALVNFIAKEEAIQAKNNHVKEMQDKIKSKCSL